MKKREGLSLVIMAMTVISVILFSTYKFYIILKHRIFFIWVLKSEGKCGIITLT